jgi:hypothetical protein
MVEATSKKDPESNLIDQTGAEVKNKTLNPLVLNLQSAFIDTQHSWESEDHFQIPAALLKGIIDGMKWSKPSKI